MADLPPSGKIVVPGFDPECPSCQDGTCRYGVRWRTLRRQEARKGTRGRRGALAVTPPSEKCTWCHQRVLVGTSWCPECGYALRFTLVRDVPKEWEESE